MSINIRGDSFIIGGVIHRKLGGVVFRKSGFDEFFFAIDYRFCGFSALNFCAKIVGIVMKKTVSGCEFFSWRYDEEGEWKTSHQNFPFFQNHV